LLYLPRKGSWWMMGRFGGFGRKVGRIRTNPVYRCRECDAEWAAVSPQKTLNKKGKLTASADAKEKVKTCPACGNANPIYFASSREALKYRELEIMLRTGLISDIELQPPFPFGDTGIEYRADFAYTDTRTGERITIDVKGLKTEVFKLKMKLMRHFYKDTVVHLVK
jgi:hypothetical protein